MKKPQLNLNEEEMGHIAVKLKNKKKFDSLRVLLITAKKPRLTQDDLLVDMMDIYEKHKPQDKQKK